VWGRPLAREGAAATGEVLAALERPEAGARLLFGHFVLAHLADDVAERVIWRYLTPHRAVRSNVVLRRIGQTARRTAPLCSEAVEG
jgi:hypothetical protein